MNDPTTHEGSTGREIHDAGTEWARRFYAEGGPSGDGQAGDPPQLGGPTWLDVHAGAAVTSARNAAIVPSAEAGTYPARIVPIEDPTQGGAVAVCRPPAAPGLSTLHKREKRAALPPLEEIDDPLLVARKVRPDETPRKRGQIEFTKGAGVVKVQRPHEQHTRQPPPRETGDIVGLSNAAARRLQIKLGKTKSDHHPVFATLTYPDVYAWTGDRLKRQIKKLWERIEYRFSGLSMVWKIEIKRRKSGSMGPQDAYLDPATGEIEQMPGKQMPHVHLLFFRDQPGQWDWAQYKALRDKIEEDWTEIVFADADTEALQEMQNELREKEHDLVQEHRDAGTRTERIRSRRGTMFYVSEYVSKAETEIAHSIGRMWGVLGRDAMPWGETVTVALGHGPACRMMRAIMRAEGLDPSGLPLARTHLCSVADPWELWARQSVQRDKIPPDRLPQWVEYISTKQKQADDTRPTPGSSFGAWEQYATARLMHKEEWPRHMAHRQRGPALWERPEVGPAPGRHNHTHPSTNFPDLCKIFGPPRT